ncbi:hypothetical protein COCCADRAFT_42045 [Bipolaris zeicola 26-R-13]|uniref:Uncharacterized protein n=1 Tax=Cochliobolus carbonum (strain 26-R-13) TaxID=930089 RepID=W6XPC3_COCC2|nr:uncharacterized protein COCCADRAFT_42045 [Bipolaris zeicola 26-R-13]EUC27125.1 hypothetical protein COCCADRAFT_42045 [Bipolaris zeicola 26-R-13]
MNTHALRGTQSSNSDILSQQLELLCYSNSRSIHNWLSKSRRRSIRDEIVSVEVNVEALHIAEGSEGEQNMEDIGNTCTAKHLPSELRMLKQPDLTVLPSTTSAHR